jgi:stearoyl-CoA desaturase (delta-9 desaturase)
MFSHEPENYVRLVPDLIRDRLLFTLNKYYLVWVIGGLILPGVIAIAFTGSFKAFLTAILWGGFVRVFLVHHSTWSINSVCHLFGASPYKTEDESRNNLVCAILTFGEGWHNNHHAFPTSARHGLAWWQADAVYGLIRVMSWVGLAWDIRLPSAEQMMAKSRSSISRAIQAGPEASSDVLPSGIGIQEQARNLARRIQSDSAS